LARDVNDDLLKNPLDEELRKIASRFTNLLQEIVTTIDKFGLKGVISTNTSGMCKWFSMSDLVRKSSPKSHSIIRNALTNTRRSFFAQYYQKRIDKYKEKLFVFLDYDGVPWNNNVAENAVKVIASRRKIMGTAFTEDGIKDYLILLSIYQTLRYRNASLWTFLLSGETSIEAFVGNNP
jgi:hypothetical protein